VFSRRQTDTYRQKENKILVSVHTACECSCWLVDEARFVIITAVALLLLWTLIKRRLTKRVHQITDVIRHAFIFCRTVTIAYVTADEFYLSRNTKTFVSWGRCRGGGTGAMAHPKFWLGVHNAFPPPNN